MVNEWLWLILMLVNFVFIIFIYAYFGKNGLYAWIGMAIIIANIQVMKTISVFGLVTALGNIIYGTTFLATDILSENHGKKAARKGVLIGFYILIAVTAIMQISLLFVPHESDAMSPALEQIFGLLPRIAVASLTAYLISQLHDVWAFNFWKRIFKGKYLWFRNNLSTMVSQLMDNIVFTLIAFVGFFGIFGWNQVFSWDIIWQIFITSYVMKLIVAVCDTPFLYLARAIKKKRAS
jgi:uncharacterized integral membrane protein (TIGR00697 family)